MMDNRGFKIICLYMAMALIPMAIFVIYSISKGAFLFHYCPARMYEANEVISEYIIDAVVNDTQLYAHKPGDDTAYILTVSTEGMPWWSPFVITTENRDWYINIIDVKELNNTKNIA